MKQTNEYPFLYINSILVSFSDLEKNRPETIIWEAGQTLPSWCLLSVTGAGVFDMDLHEEDAREEVSEDDDIIDVEEVRSLHLRRVGTYEGELS